MRKELKYFIDVHKAFLLYKLLSVFCVRDSNSNGSYNVKSLYFDTYDNYFLHEKIDGVKNQAKVRIRIYNNDFSTIKLEHKKKKGDNVVKYSKLITEMEYDDICSTPKKISTYFPDIESNALRAKTIVSYDRKALVYPMTDIRFTFDSNLRVSTSVKPDLKANLLYASVNDNKTVIFEIKYSDKLPVHIEKLIEGYSMKSSISKYAISRTET